MKDEKATVAAFGAARSGPTFIAQLGFDEIIDYVVDNHPQKVNKYTPGHKIKVEPINELYERMPDYTIILAWVHTQKIIETHQEYLKKGGKFIVCYPEISVVSSPSS